MAWHQSGDKPLSEPMMTQYTDAYMHYPASMSQHFLAEMVSGLGA